MGSFDIPSVIMAILYWRIFSAIRTRARKSGSSMSASQDPLKRQTRCLEVENIAMGVTSLMTLPNERQPDTETESKWPLLRRKSTATKKQSPTQATCSARCDLLESRQGLSTLENAYHLHDYMILE